MRFHCSFLVAFLFNTLTISIVSADQKPLENWLFVQGDLGGIWETVRPSKAGKPETVPLWTPVTLPHCFNASDAVDPDVNYYQGPGWYKTLLQIDNPYQMGHTVLHFEGAGQKSQVFVGVDKAGEHVGGYDEWSIDITEAVARFQKSELADSFEGKVPIAIRCDNSRDLEMIPSDLSDFNLYGGLYRNVHLKYLPATYLDQIRIDASVDSKGRQGVIDASVALGGRQANTTIDIKVFDSNGNVVASTSQDTAAQGTKTDNEAISLEQIAIAKPVLWSPASPNLYRCEITASSDGGTHKVEHSIGFRHLEWIPKGPFKLNGQRLLLRGTHRHEDHAGCAAAMTEDLLIQEMQMMKEMGVNFIRLGHYQQSETVLDLCDKLGILVWEEIPWCRGGLGGEIYQQQARRMLTNMIAQHRNHPSVMIWGLGNENDWPNDFATFDETAIRGFMSELNDLAHRLDPSRKTAIRRCDFCKDIIDIYSPSIWAGWYRGKFVDYQKVSEMEMKKVDHFLHVEWGASNHARRHSEDPDKGIQGVQSGKGADERDGDASMYGGQARVSKDGDWTETYACNLIDWHLKEQENMPWLTGTAYWPFKDFSTPVRPENPVPYVNQKGVIERDFTKKEAFYVFQSYWTETPMARLYGHTWPVRWGTENEKKLVKVYSNCDAAELFLNGESVGKNSRNSQDFPAAGLRWFVPFQKGTNHLRVVATKDGKEVTDEISFEYQTEKWGAPVRLELTETGRDNGTTEIEAIAFDANGIRCLDAKNIVRFALAGDGKLIDNLGTSTGSRKLELYNGRAIIRVAGQGKSVVSVSSEGLETGFVTLPAQKDGDVDLADSERDRILRKSAGYLNAQPRTVTADVCDRSFGDKHDFYSEGDYWWPNPEKPDDKYIRRDGETNPENFVAHRESMVRLSDITAALTSAYLITQDEKYAAAAVKHLTAWFADENTRMNPSLLYGQAIKGRHSGRSIGVIDTIHLAEVARGAKLLQTAKVFSAEDQAKVKDWFREYLHWINSHEYGLTEKQHPNNHGVCWSLQAAAFADYIGDSETLTWIRNQFKTVYIAEMMDQSGGFPAELARTKPYGYSLFVIDAMAGVAQIASTPEDDLWTFSLPDGRGMELGMDFIYPFIKNKSDWPHQPDVQYWNEWPVRHPSLLFAGQQLNRPEYLATWETLEPDPKTFEVLRNLPLRHPLLWIK